MVDKSLENQKSRVLLHHHKNMHLASTIPLANAERANLSVPGLEQLGFPGTE